MKKNTSVLSVQDTHIQKEQTSVRSHVMKDDPLALTKTYAFKGVMSLRDRNMKFINMI
ncbi:hypothetical protein [Chryseobacterium pennipullorum]|uniref:hypothetical protein n=1 Tax=Chryseobacterium pennipullorum TaxID=2258963 RepID=UPI001401E3B1|nr:hypothetical protein [Chryseobacterium pennipullorum]